MTAESATILASEVRWMDSQYTGRKYRISIALPYMYAKSRGEGGPFYDPPTQWPVVYLLDANWYFGMVTDMVRSSAWCGGTSDAIIVGIGYPEDEDPQEAWREAMARRNMDFTAVRSEEREQGFGEMTGREIRTGKAGDYHKFIKDELIPLVEKEYRCDPSKRILASHSLGADFATYALFQAPELFETFLIGSTSPGDYDRFIFKTEEAFAKDHKKLSTKIYLWAGELEESAGNTTVTDTLRFAAILEGRDYEGLSLTKQIFPARNHCEVVAPGLQAGLLFALKK